MKTYFQILLGALPIAILGYMFFNAQSVKEANALLHLGEDMAKEHFLIVTNDGDLQKFDEKAISLMKANLNRKYEDKTLKFLINTKLDSDNPEDILMISQSRFKKDHSSKDEIHLASLANGQISYLSREQYNQLDLSNFHYIDDIKSMSIK
jgi:hypothetical protein